MKRMLIPLLKCLLCAYILTAGLLMLLALLLYKLRLSEQIVSASIIAIYVIATFAAGFLAGKCMQKRRYLWGLLVGSAYFLILFVLSLITSHQLAAFDTHLFTTLILCTAGGALGGMLS